MIRPENRDNVYCRNILPLLDDFIAEELSEETSFQINAHLEVCNDCKLEKTSRIEIKEALRISWNSVEFPVRLETGVEEQIYTLPRFGMGLKIAASIIIGFFCISVYFLLSGSSGNDSTLQIVDNYARVAKDHIECSGKPADKNDLPLRNSIQEIEFSLVNSTNSYVLAAVMECDIKGSGFIHYVFKGNSGLLSLFVENHNMNQTLGAPGEQLKLDGTQINLVNENTMLIASLESSHHFVYIIADKLNRKEILETTGKLIGPLKRFFSEKGKIDSI